MDHKPLSGESGAPARRQAAGPAQDGALEAEASQRFVYRYMLKTTWAFKGAPVYLYIGVYACMICIYANLWICMYIYVCICMYLYGYAYVYLDALGGVRGVLSHGPSCKSTKWACEAFHCTAGRTCCIDIL